MKIFKKLKKGQHWLAFLYDINGKCTFFDSFGHSPAFFGLEAYIEKLQLSGNIIHNNYNQFFPLLVAIIVFILFY
jgi:hypothetical protein